MLTKPLRSGMTILEVTVGATLVALLLASGVQMIGALSAQQRAAERRALALVALDNVIEQITVDGGAALEAGVPAEVPLPTSIAEALPGARVVVVAEDENKPIAARRITASITWMGARRQRIATPLKLTTWVDADVEGGE